MPLAPASSAELVDLLRKSGILSADKLARLAALALPPDAQQTAAVLVAEGVITRFQAQQLLAGRHKGFRLGSYAILDLLGRGGMGAVYLGEHIELHRKVAIKVLVPGKDDDQKLALERFAREARAAAALDHPNIVRVFDVYRPGETPYIVLEYVEGETLQDIIARDGPLPYATAAEYVGQAASGLQHAHEKGFVHRDIKPANLMRDPTGIIKILDMGLARSASARDNVTEVFDAGAVVGTADYIAPEQGMSHTVDIRADIYSLGATLFALIAGRPPFEGNTTQKLLQHQMKEAPTLSSIDSTMPVGLSMVVAKMLAKKPEDRYQTPAEVIAALSPWIGGNSGLILAGMARTSVGQSIDLQATLAEISRVGRRPTPLSQTALAPQADPLIDSGEVNPVAPLKETDSVARANTVRERTRTNSPTVEKSSSPKKWLYPLAAVAILAAGALAGWFAFGGGKTDDTASGGSSPDSPPAQPHQASNTGGDTSSVAAPPPKVNPDPKTGTQDKKDPGPVVPPPKKDPPPPGPKVVYRLDLADQQPFLIRSGMTVDPKDMNKKDYRLISETGKAPAGWTARSWHKDSEIEYFSQDDGGPSIGVRNVIGPGSAWILSPVFECPGAACRIKLEYRTDIRAGRFVLKFRANDGRQAWEVGRPPSTGPTWRTEEMDIDFRGALGGALEFHNNDENPETSLQIRSLTVTEAQTKTPEKVLFSLDAADVPFFKHTKVGSNKTEGTDAPAIKGIGFVGWKPDTVSAWECGNFAGARAIAFTNLNEPISAQIALELERPNTGMGFTFEPGQQLRLRVVYRTAGKGRGQMYFQVGGDPTYYGSASLPNANNAWKTVDVLATRADKGLRCLIDTQEKGEGNTLYIRSISLLDAGKAPPPKKNPPPKTNPTPKTNPMPPVNPNDISTWAEGAVVHNVTFADVPDFRVQKEKGMRLGGEPEKLPPGISCHCWKDKSVGDFRCEKVEGVQALGLTNLNDELSAQFVFALESGMKLPLEPGKSYRVKIGYMTKNEAAAHSTVHVVPGFKGIGNMKLANTGGKWATAAVSFTRPPAADNVEVRLTIDNDTFGEGNTVWIRSLDILELVTPTAKK